MLTQDDRFRASILAESLANDVKAMIAMEVPDDVIARTMADILLDRCALTRDDAEGEALAGRVEAMVREVAPDYRSALAELARAISGPLPTTHRPSDN